MFGGFAVAASRLVVNGVEYKGPCRLEMKDGHVFVDGGACALPKEPAPVVYNITVHGDVQGSLTAAGGGTVQVDGSVGDDIFMPVGGDVRVKGSCAFIRSTHGTVQANSVTGSVETTHGDIKIHGDVGLYATSVHGDVIVRGRVDIGLAAKIPTSPGEQKQATAPAS